MKEKKEQFHLGLFLFLVGLICLGPFLLWTGYDFVKNAVEGSLEYTCFGCGVPLTRAGSIGMRGTGLLLISASFPISYVGLGLFWKVYLSSFFKR